MTYLLCGYVVYSGYGGVCSLVGKTAVSKTAVPGSNPGGPAYCQCYYLDMNCFAVCKFFSLMLTVREACVSVLRMRMMLFFTSSCPNTMIYGYDRASLLSWSATRMWCSWCATGMFAS